MYVCMCMSVTHTHTHNLGVSGEDRLEYDEVNRSTVELDVLTKIIRRRTAADIDDDTEPTRQAVSLVSLSRHQTAFRQHTNDRATLNHRRTSLRYTDFIAI